MPNTINYKKSTESTPSLTALTAAALILPGLLQPVVHADEDSVDFQYSHYQEGNRNVYGGIDLDQNASTPDTVTLIPKYLNPIEVDSVHGSSRFTLTDRVKFAFNYTQDTWSGATPLGTALAHRHANKSSAIVDNSGNIIGISGASIKTGAMNEAGYSIDKNSLKPYQSVYNQALGRYEYKPIDGKLTHVLSYASPETRQQGDFKLTYEWDEAALDVGGGISVENDYESRFANLGGRFDFNQKQTTLNWGVSYTNSDTFATLDPEGMGYFNTSYYDTAYLGFVPDQDLPLPIPIKPLVDSGRVEAVYGDITVSEERLKNILHGNRQDWGLQLGASQLLNKNALISLDLGYTRSTGYQANPYKGVYGYTGEVKPDQEIIDLSSSIYLEIRPDERNLFNWHLGYDQYIEPVDAALHVDYSFAHDDWGINAHTVEADWAQPLGAGWMLTPRVRYYSQSSADFYTTGIIQLFDYSKEVTYNEAGTAIVGGPGVIRPFPKYYSSDQRLSGFGSLSGGLTVSKQFTKGVSLETGFEYYTHQGGLKLGGGGEADFADYDYWVANAALKVNLGALKMGGGSHDNHEHRHHHHSNSPAGVMFDHTLPRSGDFMAGYRYMRSEQAGDMLLGSDPVSLDVVNTAGCDGKECAVTPNNMTMNMHMLDLMVAPTNWLTLMLMPQWMDMGMTMTPNPNFTGGGHGGHGAVHDHEIGGIGDTGLYALFKVFDQPRHHLTLSLGGTAPTGDVNITLRKTASNPVYDQPIHYGMQLGSGTWDFKPALTYTGNQDKFGWGAQATATIRLEDRNESGFAFGDIFQGSVWGGYQWTNWLATTVRGVYTSQGAIQGASASATIDPNTNLPFVPQHIGPFDFPANYGGEFVDLGLGINVNIPSGAFAGNSLKFEWLQPLHTDYNGYQLDREGALSATWSVGF
ncbi:MAG: DUF3570 domain-containing protein [Methyloglobulus sp.]|nr:DUF3570 domain-containing protein [Methyloglobulus sp.]